MSYGVSLIRVISTKHELVYRIMMRDKHLNGVGFSGRDALSEISVLWLNGVLVLRQH